LIIVESYEIIVSFVRVIAKLVLSPHGVSPVKIDNGICANQP